MSIQGSINSMIGSASRAVVAVKGYQALKQKQVAAAAKEKAKQAASEQKQVAQKLSSASPQKMAADKAKQSVANAVEAKQTQQRDFMEYLKKQPSSLGKIGDLDPALQKKIADAYTPAMRKQLMATADREAKSGKHK